MLQQSTKQSKENNLRTWINVSVGLIGRKRSYPSTHRKALIAFIGADRTGNEAGCCCAF